MDSPWEQHIQSEMQKEYFIKLRAFIKSEQLTKQIYPDNNLIFNAFEQCPYYDLKVVIIGNEPYTNGGDHGLAWSTTKHDIPDSLFNIFKEVRKDMFEPFENTNMVIHRTNNLTQWANQGVLFLNTLLTSEKGKQYAHKNKGWELFMEATLKKINEHQNKVVFMLWGKEACGWERLIDTTKHLVLTSSHPSSHTAQQGFMGCKHFSTANEFIKKHYFNQRLPIRWHLF